MITSLPSSVTSGLLKWHRAPNAARVEASIKFPSWFNMWMSTRTSHAFSSTKIHRLSRSTHLESRCEIYCWKHNYLIDVWQGSTFYTTFNQAVNLNTKLTESSGFKMFRSHCRHFNVNEKHSFIRSWCCWNLDWTRNLCHNPVKKKNELIVLILNWNSSYNQWIPCVP